MRHIVEAGTDAASLLLFDPSALPEEFDAANAGGDPTEILSALNDQGRLFWINTDGDGGYLLHAFVDEQPAAELRQYLSDPQTSDQFTVNSGRIFFTGAEYGFRNDDSRLRSYPAMGGSFPAENGTYSITVYRAEYPDGLHDERFRQQATPAQQRIHRTYSALMVAAVLAVIAAIVGLFAVSWLTWFKYFVPAALVAIGLTMLVSRLSIFKTAEKIWQTVNHELPSIVAVLVRQD